MSTRILFLGNTGNLGFRICGWLRRKGVNATLLLPKSTTKHCRSLPEWENPTLKGSYPDWIKFSGNSRFPAYLPDQTTLRQSKDCDLVFSTGEFVISALCLSKPVVFVPVGGDLTELPFLSNKLITSWRSHVFKKRIKRVSRILTCQEDCIWAARFLGVGEKIALFPLPVDCNSINENINNDLKDKLSKQYSELDFVFLNPSRKNIDPNRFSYKGNEKFLHAFKLLIQKHPRIKIKAVLGMHGHHREEFKQLVLNSGIKEYCHFEDHLPLGKLHAYISLDNAVVFDQFGSCAKFTLGGISRETLALGSPLVVNTDTESSDFVNVYGGECPLIRADSEEDIYDSMKKIILLPPEQFNQLRKDSTKWALQNIHWEGQIDKLLLTIEDVLRERNP